MVKFCLDDAGDASGTVSVCGGLEETETSGRVRGTKAWLVWVVGSMEKKRNDKLVSMDKRADRGFPWKGEKRGFWWTTTGPK